MRHSTIAVFSALALAVVGETGAAAGTVTLERTAGGRISIVADDASLDEVLATLSKAYAFKVDRLGYRLDSEPLTGRFDGSVRTVLTRLLQDENHIIQNSARAKAGIASISIYSAVRPQNSGPNLARPAPTPVPLRPVTLAPAPIVTPKAVQRPLRPPASPAQGVPVGTRSQPPTPPIDSGPPAPAVAPSPVPPPVTRGGRR